MQASAAARRYARALFEISREDHKVAEVRGELARLSETLEENRDLRDALFTPLHPADERKKVLDAVAASLGLSQTVKHFQSHLIDRRRLVDFPEAWLSRLGGARFRQGNPDSSQGFYLGFARACHHPRRHLFRRVCAHGGRRGRGVQGWGREADGNLKDCLSVHAGKKRDPARITTGGRLERHLRAL